jgi:hypothetical protein
MYGPVAHMMTAQYDSPDYSNKVKQATDWRALHLVLCNDKSQRQMGMTMDQLLMYEFEPAQVKLHAYCSDDVIEFMRACMADVPVSRLPDCPYDMDASAVLAEDVAQLRRKATEKKRDVVSTRALDFDQCRTSDFSDLSQAQSIVRIPIAEHCECVELLV